MAEDTMPSPTFNIHISEEEYREHGPVHDEVVKCVQDQPPESWGPILKALSWIVCAKRPLAKEELHDALAVREGMTDLSSNDRKEIDQSFSAIPGLIQIHEEDIVLRRFVNKHGRCMTQSRTRETISLRPDVAQYFAKTWKSWFPRAHHDIAVVCIAYLSFEVFDCENPATDRYELHSYASQYWGYHANMQPVDQSIILGLLESSNKLSACVKDLSFAAACGCCPIWRPKRISKLHLVVYFGLEDVLKTLLEGGLEVDVKDDEDRTPLSWAIELGHQSIVKYLLDQGANPNIQEHVQTPLIWSVINGSIELFDMLTKYGAGRGNEGPTYKRVLLFAAGKGQEDFVRMLLGKNMDFDIRDQDCGRSPISRAAEFGRENVVKFLLSQGADANSKDVDGELESEKNEGKTPLTWATLEGHWSIVDLLLQHGAEPVLPPVNPVALLDAARAGKYEKVRRFLENAVSPDFRGERFGCSPLSEAAEFGHVDVVRLLLDWGVDPNSKDINGEGAEQNEGKTPLMRACMNGHNPTARILLDRGADPNLQEKDGKAALSWAAVNGHRSTVRLLLEHGGDVMQKDKYGYTAFNSASMHSHNDIAQLLLEMGAAREPSAKAFEMPTFKHEPLRYTPLPTPTSIRLLSLIESSSVQGETGLGTPWMHCSLDVVDLNDDPHFESLSYTWGSPFPVNTAEATEYHGENDSWPIVVNGRMFFIKKNLHDFLRQEHSRGKAVDERLTPHNKTGLIQAAEEGRFNSTRFYLRAGANTEVQDVFGKTALHYASQEGHLEVLKLLVEAGADPQKLDNTGSSPFTYAGEHQQSSQAAQMVHFLGRNSDSHRRAIRRVRPRRFWIDAICINQDDLSERNSQVSILPQMYRKAVSVLVWLGVADKFTPYASDSLKIHSPPTQEWARLTQMPGAYRGKGVRVSLQCMGIINLMNRTWFQRVWVLQEAALAPHIQIFCGEYQFDYLEIFWLLQCCLFRIHARKRNQLFNPGIRYDMGGSEGYIVTDIRLRTTPTIPERNLVERKMMNDNIQLAPSWQRALSLPLLLSRVWTMKATDPRDKIFALLGIARGPTIVADYTEPTSEVFISAARLFLQGAPDETFQFWQTGEISKLEYLEGLSYVQRLAILGKTYQLPSWVPDFGVPLFTNRLWSPRFKAGVTSTGSPRIRFLDPHALEVSGVLVDEIIAMDERHPEPWTLRYLPQKWLEIILVMPPTYVTGENRTEALCRTLMANATHPSSVEDSDSELRLSFRDFIKRSLCFAMNIPEVVEHLRELRKTDPSDSLPSEEEMAEFLTDLKTRGKEGYTHDKMHMVSSGYAIFESGFGNYYAGRRLFRTGKGLLGLGPYSIQQGDQVWVVPGGRTPYIFRPLSDSRPLQREFIGESYVHGIMDGEVMSEKNWPELQPVVLV